MQIREFVHSSTDGKHNIYAKMFVPDNHPKAVIQIVHGVAEHIGRYDGFAGDMAKRGYLVCGTDLLGHGLSAEEGEQGFFAESDGWNTVCEDLKLFYEIVSREYPQPYFVLGHSMGSFLAETIYYKRMIPMDGLILLGDGTMSLLKIKAARFIAKKEYSKLEDKKGTSKLINKLSLGSYNKKVTKNPRTPSDWISSDRDEVDKYISDPMCGFDPSVKLFLDMLDGLEFINTKANVKKCKKSVPVFIGGGSKDPVGNMGKGPAKIQKKLKDAGVKRVRLRIYDGMRHELHHSSCAKTLFEDIDTWITMTIAKIE